MLYDEKNMLTDDVWSSLENLLKLSKHACLYIQNECKARNYI